MPATQTDLAMSRSDPVCPGSLPPLAPLAAGYSAAQKRTTPRMQDSTLHPHHAPLYSYADREEEDKREEGDMPVDAHIHAD